MAVTVIGCCLPSDNYFQMSKRKTRSHKRKNIPGQLTDIVFYLITMDFGCFGYKGPFISIRGSVCVPCTC